MYSSFFIIIKKLIIFSNTLNLDYTDNADFWIRGYDVNDFRPRMEYLWNQLKPLYLQIHAYARRKLWEKYGRSVISRKGPIPAHLLGKFTF